jgi:hypothetical protein
MLLKKSKRYFDQQLKKAVLNECKIEIPTRGIPSIMDEYFSEFDKILQEYLTFKSNVIKWLNHYAMM